MQNILVCIYMQKYIYTHIHTYILHLYISVFSHLRFIMTCGIAAYIASVLKARKLRCREIQLPAPEAEVVSGRVLLEPVCLGASTLLSASSMCYFCSAMYCSTEADINTDDNTENIKHTWPYRNRCIQPASLPTLPGTVKER